MHAVAVAIEESERPLSEVSIPIELSRSPASPKRPAGSSGTLSPQMLSKTIPLAFGKLAVLTQDASSQCLNLARPAISSALQKLSHVRGPQSSYEGASSLRQELAKTLAQQQRRSTHILAFAAFVVFGWAAWVPLAGAIVVPGNVVVQTNVKKVQHPQGGIVAAILVQNGSKVVAGEELARFDQTSARANLQVIARQLDEVRLRIARLKAERDNLQTPRWPSNPAADLASAERDELLASERDLFVARSSTRRGQQELAETRINQLEKQIVALDAQLNSNGKQADITGGELKGVEELLRQKLVTLPRATALQREAAHLDGMKGQLMAQIAETRAKESETRLQALQADENFRSDVMRDLREVRGQRG